MNQPESLDFMQARQKLVDAGMEQKVAEAVLETVSGTVVTAAATKFDLERTGSRLDKRISEVENRLDQQRIVALDEKIDAKMEELCTDIVKIGVKIDTKMEELQNTIKDVVSRSTRNIGILIGLLLAVLILYDSMRPIFGEG